MNEQERVVKREHVASTSGDVSEAQVARLRQLLPEVFASAMILPRSFPLYFASSFLAFDAR